MNEPRHAAHERDALDKLLNALRVDVLSCGVCSIPRNSRARFDATSCITVSYVIAGAGLLQLGNEVALPIIPQDIIIAPARTLQFWAGDGSASRVIEGRNHCTPVDDKLAQLLTDGQSNEALSIVRCEIRVSNGIGEFFGQLRKPIVENVAQQDAARLALESMITELVQLDLGFQAVADGLMKIFLILVLRQHLKRGNETSSIFAILSEPRLARAMVEVLDRPELLHTLESLSAAAGMSRTAFSEKFREVFDQTPNEYIQGIRLNLAARLLTTTTLPIQTIATSVGYTSRSYFSRAFRNRFTLDPSTYRNTKQPFAGI